MTLQWRHNGHDGVANNQPHGCLLNHLFMHRSKKTLKLPVTGLCEGNSPVTGEFPAQRARNAENVSIWWRHHGIISPLKISWDVIAHSCPKLWQTSKKAMYPTFVIYHYSNHLMDTMASKITSFTIVYSTVYSDTDQRKNQSSASLAFVGTGEFPAAMASNAENVSVWWRHHDMWEQRLAQCWQ